MRTIWISRHGHREDFIGDAWGDVWHRTAARPHDPALAELGVRQATELGQRLRDRGIAHLFASPFLRTVQTAQHVADAIDRTIKVEHGICEWLNPQWYNKPPDFLPLSALKQRFDRVDVTYEPRVRPLYPEVNEPTEVWPRVARTLDLLLAQFEGDLLFIGHGSSCAGLVEALAGPGCGFGMRMCAVTRFTGDRGKWALLDKGCVKHLSESETQLRFA
jgi:broad specificity phosphatase PhoE